MKRCSLLAAAIAGGLAIVTGASALAQTPTQTQARGQGRVYGSQLMTPQERTEYQQRMRDLKTQAERDPVRADHHATMQARATERGVTLPAEPPAQGRGMGPRAGNAPGAGAGAGLGGGAGPGGAAGPGGGKGR